MKIKSTIFLLVALILSIPIFADNTALHYEPEIATLTGVIKVKKYPAPSKSEAIGDKEEIYRYLVLDYPVDVLPQKSDKTKKNWLQENITEVQVVRIEDYYKVYRSEECENYYQQKQSSKNKKSNSQCSYSNWSDEFINKHVRITGILRSRIVRVVMVANNFEIIK